MLPGASGGGGGRSGTESGVAPAVVATAGWGAQSDAMCKGQQETVVHSGVDGWMGVPQTKNSKNRRHENTRRVCVWQHRGHTERKDGDVRRVLGQRRARVW